MKILSYLKSRLRYGFTLIELLLVIGIIAILASIVIVAINPTKQLGDARDAQRRSDVNTILNAVYQYAIDNNGVLPTGIPTGSIQAAEVCKTGAGTTCHTAGTNTGISLDVLTGSYLVSIPADPQAPALGNAGGSGTQYEIYQDSNGRIIVTAETNEGTQSISVTR